MAEEFDFDGFDEAAEQAAIEAIAESAQPDFIIVEGDLVTRFPDGQIIRTPLNIPYSTLEPIIAASDDPAGQLEALLRLLGNDDDAETLRGQGLFSVQVAAKRYFTTWQKVQGVTVGESKGSSK